MQNVCEPDAMREAEKRSGVEPLVLMERAARALADALPPEKTVAFACGGGMNGGDGFAAAAMRAEAGRPAWIWRAADEDKLYGDARTEYGKCRKANVKIYKREELDDVPVPDIWVDALFGIGLNRPVEGAYAECARRMARDRLCGAQVIAADIPSGIDGMTGRALGEAVCADRTIPFGWMKPGHLLGDGFENSGELTVADIGLADTDLPWEPIRLVETKDARERLPARKRNSHKGTYGHLLILAGSVGMAGAAAICASAAMRCGAGLTTVVCPKEILSIVQTLAPCATCAPLPDDADAAQGVFREAMRGKDALAVGPGLSRKADPRLIRDALLSGIPAVFDADALNLIAGDPSMQKLLNARHIVTPHPGEAARLLGRTCDDPVRDARALRNMGCVALLKGATSVICGEHTYLSASGTPGMAKGGSGDALTGMIGALLAQGLSPEDAGWVASEMHGVAGEIAAKHKGRASMLATDLTDCIGEAFGI